MSLDSPEPAMPHYTAWAKQRALECISKENPLTDDLLKAIDSMVLDLSRDATRLPEEKAEIQRRAGELKAQPLLTKEPVVNFIQSFEEK